MANVKTESFDTFCGNFHPLWQLLQQLFTTWLSIKNPNKRALPNFHTFFISQTNKKDSQKGVFIKIKQKIYYSPVQVKTQTSETGPPNV